MSIVHIITSRLYERNVRLIECSSSAIIQEVVHLLLFLSFNYYFVDNIVKIRVLCP